ncbi:hypothetical protein AAHH67_15295 [Niallia circulans]
MSDEIISNVDIDTYLVTAQNNEKKIIEKAVYDFETKSNFRSTYFNETNGLVNIKIEEIDNLAHNAQTSLQNVLKINNIVRYFVNKNDILGKVYEAIETNINADWQIDFPNYNEEEKIYLILF